MKISVLSIGIILSISVFSQDKFLWEKNYPLDLSDFRSGSTKIGDVNIYSVQSGITLDFGYQMNQFEFMFKKNFNSYASCSFNTLAATIIAPDSGTAECLLKFTQFEFDLTELYARKFRKRLFEEKKMLSNPDFFQPIFDEIHNELNERNSKAADKTDLGRNSEILSILHKEVLHELEELADYCYSCDPPKKKKKK